MYLNLISVASQKRRSMKHAFRFWGRVWLCVMIVGTLSSYRQYATTAAQSELAATAKTQAEPLIQARNEVTRLRKQVESDKALHRKIASVFPNDPTLRLIATISESIETMDGAIQMQNISASSNLVESEKAGNTDVKGYVYSMNVSGLALDEHSVSLLMHQLGEQRIFAKLELKSLSQVSFPNGVGQQFQIECVYNEHPPEKAGGE